MTVAEGFDLDASPTPSAALLSDLWAHRGLLAVLARKDFVVRYRRASLGLLWALGLPLFQAAVLALVFGRFVHIGGSDYAVFVLAGVVPWTFVSSTIGTGVTAIVDGAELSTRIWFPRALFPLVIVAANAYGLVIGVAALVVVGAAMGVFGPQALLVIPAAALAVLLTAAVCLVTAALQVAYRDVRYLVQAGLLAWFYVTPVIYPLSATKGLAPWLRANPATGVIETFRAATVGAGSAATTSIAWTVGWSVALLGLALVLYRRNDRTFADLL